MSRRERKKEETRGNIIDTAISLFQQKSFEDTSMEEIAEKSDVSKGTLYNYFQDKESILVGYFQIVIADYFEEIKESFAVTMDIETRLYTLLSLMSKIFKNHDELALIYFKHRMKSPIDANLVDSSQRSGIEKWVLEIMEKAQGNGQLRNDIPAFVLTRNFQFLAMSFFVSSIYTKETLDIDIIKNQLIGLFLNGAKQ